MQDLPQVPALEVRYSLAWSVHGTSGRLVKHDYHYSDEQYCCYKCTHLPSPRMEVRSRPEYRSPVRSLHGLYFDIACPRVVIVEHILFQEYTV